MHPLTHTSSWRGAYLVKHRENSTFHSGVFCLGTSQEVGSANVQQFHRLPTDP
jgi:hypothetical protein